MNVTVRARAAHNPTPKVWYRVPEGYKATKGRTWRALVIFGGRNCEGEAEVSGKLGWTQWADRHGVFLVAPGFKDDQYWEPQAWSGRALLAALAEIKKSYDIDTSKLLYYGYSAGSQAANLFAAWRPDLCRAWVSHACGVFHEPNTRMKGVPGLVTCGDADAARDILSRDFVAKARKVVCRRRAGGARVGVAHGRPRGSAALPNAAATSAAFPMGIVCCVGAARGRRRGWRHRFTDAAVTVVSPPEFCILPQNVQIIR